MIKAIIFDFDKMLHITAGLFSSWVIKKYNLSEEAVKQFFSNEFSLCRIGKADTKEVLRNYLPKFRWKGSVDDFMKCWYEYGEFDEELIKLIKSLKKRGAICVLATNNEKYRIKYYIENYGLDKLFDHLLLSAELGYLKPDKKMLNKILEVAGVKKEEILFCDDKEEFIKIAKEFGFQTYLYDNVENFESFLNSKELAS